MEVKLKIGKAQATLIADGKKLLTVEKNGQKLLVLAELIKLIGEACQANRKAGNEVIIE